MHQLIQHILHNLHIVVAFLQTYHGQNAPLHRVAGLAVGRKRCAPYALYYNSHKS